MRIVSVSTYDEHHAVVRLDNGDSVMVGCEILADLDAIREVLADRFTCPTWLGGRVPAVKLPATQRAWERFLVRMLWPRKSWWRRAADCVVSTCRFLADTIRRVCGGR